MTRTPVKEKEPGVFEVTHSRLSTFWDCSMKEYFQYRAKGVGVVSAMPYDPFIEGELGHYALMYFHRSGRMLRANMLARVEKILDRFRPLEPETDDRIRTKLAAMVGATQGYKMRYAGDSDRYETILSEEPFEFDLGGVKVRGKLDWLAFDKKEKKTVLWEHKFLSSVNASNYTVLPMDDQGLIYCEGVKALTGKYPDLKAWNFIIKSQLRRKKDKMGGKESFLAFEARVQQAYIEKPERFFRPPPLRVETGMVKTLKEQLLPTIERMTTEEPRMEFNCLGMYGQPCLFVQACTAKLQGHKDGWDAPECHGMYKIKQALHPELERDTTEEPEKGGKKNGKKA